MGKNPLASGILKYISPILYSIYYISLNWGTGTHAPETDDYFIQRSSKSMIKARLFTLFILTLTCISNANANAIDDINQVKNGAVDFDKTVTVGQALDYWKSCMSRDWSSFKKNNGATVVEFNCQHHALDYMKEVEKFLSGREKKSPHINIKSLTQTFQFTLNLDGSFQLDNVKVYLRWKDNVVFSNPSPDAEKELKAAYNNRITWDPTMKPTKRNVPYFVKALKEMRAEGLKQMR